MPVLCHVQTHAPRQNDKDDSCVIDELSEELQTLAAKLFIEIAQPRHVPSGMRQARHQPLPYGISRKHDDGDGPSGFHGRARCLAVGHHHDIHFETDKLSQ